MSPAAAPAPSEPLLPLTEPHRSVMTPAPSPLAALVAWDKDVSYLIYRHFNTPRLPLLALEVSGHGVPWLVAPVLVFVFKAALSPTAAALMLNFLALTCLDLAVIGLLKPLFRRKRPAYNSGIGHVTIHVVDQFSFPSGHATRAGFLAAFVCFVRRRHQHGLHPLIDSDTFMFLVFAWALAVCASRVALGRHHLLDVVFGALLGATYVFLWEPLWISPTFATQLRDMLRGELLGTAKLATAATGLQSQL